MRQFAWRFLVLALLWAFWAVSTATWGLAYSGSDAAGVGSQDSGTGPEIPGSQQNGGDGDMTGCAGGAGTIPLTPTCGLPTGLGAGRSPKLS